MNEVIEAIKSYQDIVLLSVKESKYGEYAMAKDLVLRNEFLNDDNHNVYTLFLESSCGSYKIPIASWVNTKGKSEYELELIANYIQRVVYLILEKNDY